MLEHEIKFKLKDKAQILKKLHALKAKDFGQEFEKDSYFKNKNEPLEIRVREFSDGTGLMTLKRMLQKDGLAKVREETETKISNASKTIKILELMGLTYNRSKEKRRHTFKLDHTKILIDRIPFLGYFLELESDREENLRETAKILGLDLKNSLNLNYEALFYNFIDNSKDIIKGEIKFSFESEEKYFNP